ncbi:MAG: molybdopterin biosynthesis protein [Candidatus Methanosuratincola sp.]|nr:molybdopterin biosynthesis protein [Candidatus Methanosuratincola sp.]
MTRDERKIFHRLATLEEASIMLSGLATHLPEPEKVGLSQAFGRVLSRTLYSKIDLPPFDRAEMDGYAVLSSDTEGASETAPLRLRVVGRVDAGSAYRGEVAGGSCVEIATGAPVPRGADAVLMVEHTSRSGDFIEVYKPVTPGENIAHTGSDLEIGEAVLRKGAVIGVREVALLSAAGFGEVEVYGKPKVGIISTGNELVEPGLELPPGKIYDVNSQMLGAAVAEAGGTPSFVRRVGDDLETIKGRIAAAIDGTDLVLISGGTSAGLGDAVYRAIGELCDPGIVAHGLKIKPGKPTVIATHKGKAVIGLPGYPVSALMVFNQIVRPLIQRMTMVKGRSERVVEAALTQRVNSAKGRRWFLPVHLLGGDGQRAYPIFASSGAVGTLARADGYIVVPEDIEYIEGGEGVKVRLFGDPETKDGLVVMGSHCPALDLLLEMLFEEKGISARALNVGSLGGLNAVARGECDLAGIHLLDEATMTYNTQFVRRAGLPDWSLVKGYRRTQGIAIPKGNPKGVTGLRDLIRRDLIFANRNRGSGTRVLTDRMLKVIADELGLDFRDLVGRIRGYRSEFKTHSSVAAAVGQGRADLGVCVKGAAVAYGLDFIPIADEEYDFVINPECKEKEEVKEFLGCLRSNRFREMAEKLEGYAFW